MNPFDKQQITTTDSDALKTCIENDGCEPAGVVITQQSECSLINEKYAKSITINDSIQCGSKVTSFVISGYPNLESITIGKNGMYSGSGFGEVLIENSPKLKTIQIGTTGFESASSVTIRNCENLESIDMGENAFRAVKSYFHLQSKYNIDNLWIDLEKFTTLKLGTTAFRDTVQLIMEGKRIMSWLIIRSPCF